MAKIKTNSLVNVGSVPVQVEIDPYAANPLLADALQVITIRPRTPAPKMFSNGTADLPAFTASGLDPALLLRLPFTARHAAAALPDPGVLHQLFEEAAGQPTATIPHEGLTAAVSRMRVWVLDIGEAA